MPLVRRRLIPLPLEHMTQMAPARCARDLSPLHPPRPIDVPVHRARQTVEVSRPAAPALEFVRGRVQRGVAGGAFLCVTRVSGAGEKDTAVMFWKKQKRGGEKGTAWQGHT